MIKFNTLRCVSISKDTRLVTDHLPKFVSVGYTHAYHSEAVLIKPELTNVFLCGNDAQLYNTNTNTHTLSHTHTNTHTHTHTHSHTHTLTHTHTHTHTLSLIRTHTHIHTLSRSYALTHT